MQLWGIDFAWGRASVASLKAAHVQFVGRYFSHDRGKTLSHAECAGYRSAGIGILMAFEDSAQRALEGETAGREDAHFALQEALASGFDGPIHLAVDFDASGPEVFHYFRGARAVLGHRAGVYGGYRVVKYLFDNGLVSSAWQTYAWSGGQWDHRALYRQYSNDHTVAGLSCDYDVALGPVAHHAASPLAPLIPSERRAANTLLHYQRHPRQHEHGLRVTHELLVTLRKQVWRAAVKGVAPSGKRTPKGWGIRNRAARYHELARLTGWHS